ncbi:MAG: hypothetical protein ACI91F_002729 [Candidatus Binatia bacterium]|jgi:hypothetical protein
MHCVEQVRLAPCGQPHGRLVPNRYLPLLQSPLRLHCGAESGRVCAESVIDNHHLGGQFKRSFGPVLTDIKPLRRVDVVVVGRW